MAQALKAAGIDEEDSADAREEASEGAWAAALRFAARKRIGPYAAQEPDRAGRERAFAAMLRAGHRSEFVRRIINARPGAIPEMEKL